MKKIKVLLIVLVCLAAVGGVAAVAQPRPSPYRQAGNYFRQAQLEGDVVARYRDHEVMRATVEYYRKMDALSESTAADGGSAREGDREIIDSMLKGTILYEEAVARGYAATQEEVDETMEAIKTAYYENWSGAENIDEYCAGAGITVEEYFDLLTEQMPRTISRQKLKDAVGREYCEAHGIEFTKMNQPAEIQTYVQNYIDDLFLSHADEIVYDTSVS